MQRAVPMTNKNVDPISFEIATAMYDKYIHVRAVKCKNNHISFINPKQKTTI